MPQGRAEKRRYLWINETEKDPQPEANIHGASRKITTTRGEAHFDWCNDDLARWAGCRRAQRDIRAGAGAPYIVTPCGYLQWFAEESSEKSDESDDETPANDPVACGGFHEASLEHPADLTVKDSV